MNRFLSSAFFLFAISAASAQAQTANTSAAPATEWAQPELDPWTMNASATAAEKAAPTTTEPSGYNTGWSSAPGISLSLHNKPSTDWWGRPIKKKAKNNLTTDAVAQAAVADEVSDDPMMHSSGVMIAPGMNTAPYRGTSTDYWGRPVRKAKRQDAKVAAKIAKSSTVATTAEAGQLHRSVRRKFEGIVVGTRSVFLTFSWILMRYPRLIFLLALLGWLTTAAAQAQTKRSSGYHKKASAARSRPVARAASSRRYTDEDRQRLAPGMRINMPTPPSTDYMGRPIKKKVAKPASTSSTITSEKAAPTAPARKRK